MRDGVRLAPGAHGPDGINAKRAISWPIRLAPGVLACVALSGLAVALQALEGAMFGRVWLEALVLAIVVGALVRSVWTPSARFEAGIAFSARALLEIAVLLLGTSVSANTLMSIGPPMLLGIALVVVAAIGASYGIGRRLGLSPRMAALVACGNSICGNSAIAAVAPVIGADGKDVAAAIAFTAVLGVAAVLGLPLIGAALHMGAAPYGVFAGLTVYAVPQVLAAAAPMGAQAIQVGTLVKLVRVLMLGPVCCIAALIAGRSAPGHARTVPPLHRLVPWFILGFLGLAVLRAFDLIPSVLLQPAAGAASVLTVVSMAALGLMTDLKAVARAGGPVTAAVSLSLLVLGAIGYGLVRLLGVG